MKHEGAGAQSPGSLDQAMVLHGFTGFRGGASSPDAITTGDDRLGVDRGLSAATGSGGLVTPIVAHDTHGQQVVICTLKGQKLVTIEVCSLPTTRTLNTVRRSNFPDGECDSGV